MTPQPHRDACARCHDTHPARIAADGQHTYRHPDGHAWTPPAEVAPLARLTTPTPDDYEVLFGQWAFCRRCGGSTSNTRAGMDGHRAMHDELEQLRADVDRLNRIVNGRGGGAA